MPQSIQPLRGTAIATTPVAMVRHCARSTVKMVKNFTHTHMLKDTKVGTTELSVRHGGFPGVKTPSYTHALHSPFSFSGAFLAVSQISHQTQCHHSLSWFLHNLKNNYCFPTLDHPASQLRKRNIITLLGQNHHLLERFQYFLLKSAVIPGQGIRNLPKSLEEQDASWWVAGL